MNPRATLRPTPPHRRLRHLGPCSLAALAAACLILSPAPAPAAATATGPAPIPRVSVPPGSELRPRASWSAAPSAVLTGGELPLVGLGLGGWTEVESPAGTGWVDLGDPAGWPLSSATILARARRLLGEAAAIERRLGPFAAASDLGTRRTWSFFERLASAVPAIYTERYGLPIDPLGGRAAGGLAETGARPETVVLFAREEDYRRLFPSRPHRAGQAGDGFAVLYLGDRLRTEAGTTLVHELTHLLNRRALGPELPPWLDEGLAEDMALARVGPGGGLDPSPLTARALRTSSGRRLHGALLQLPALAARAGSGALPGLAELVALDRATFDRSPDRELLYALYGLWVRYLMEDDRRAAAFRGYLAAYPQARPLPDLLGARWAELDRAFAEWLTDLPHRLELTPGADRASGRRSPR